MKRPLTLFPLYVLHMLLATGAVYGGWSLMTNPYEFGMQAEWLSETPFHSFFLPGFILFIFNGIFPLFILWGLLFKPVWPAADIFNIYRDRHWAWTYSLFSGIILIIWITVQLTMVPAFWLQPVCLFAGVLILVLTLWPGTMQYYQKTEQ